MSPRTASKPPDAPGERLLSRTFVLLLLSHGGFCFGASVFLLLPKYLTVELGAGPAGIGLVMASFGIAGVLAIPWIGRAVDRSDGPDRRTLYLGGMVLMVAAAFGFVPVEGAGPHAVALRSLQGLSWMLEVNAGMAILADIVPAGRIAQALGLFGAVNIAVNAIAPALMEPLAAAIGFRYTFVIGGVAAVAGWTIALCVPPEGARPPTQAAGPADVSVLLRDPNLRLILVVMMVTGLASAAAFTFIAPFALERGLTVVSPFFVAFTCGALAVRLGSGRLVDRLGPRRVAFASVLLYGFAVAGLALLAPGRLAPLAFVFGVVQGVFFPSSMAMAVAATPREHRGKMLVLSNGGYSVGAAAVLLLGLAAGPLGYGRLFAILGGATLASSALLWRARAGAPAGKC
jgi:predicted MFS family arabinose efflux permease